MLGLLVSIVLLALGWFQPVAATVALGMIYGYFLIMQLWGGIGQEPDPKKFSEEEIEIIRKYHMHIRFPGLTRRLSAFMAIVQIWVIIPVAGILIYREHYLWAALPVLLYFVSGYLRPSYDPQFFLTEAANRATTPDDRYAFIQTSHVLEVVMMKIYGDPLAKYDDPDAEAETEFDISKY